MYQLVIFHNPAPAAPIAVLKSAQPFHSIVAGQKIELPGGALTPVLDVFHMFQADAAGNVAGVVMQVRV